MVAELDGLPLVRQRYGRLRLTPLWAANRPGRRYSGYSSFRQLRGPAGWAFGVRSSRELKYGATNGSGADTVQVW